MPDELDPTMVSGANLFRNLKLALGLMLLLVLVGTGGYMGIERVGFTDALFMTVITLTTVGYSYIKARPSVAGEMFTIGLLVVGVIIAGWATRTVLEFAVSETAREAIRRRRMRGEVAKMSNQFIICGYGRMGREVSLEFRKKRVPHVIVESQPEAVAELAESGVPIIVGDGADEDVLRDAGIERARGLIAVAGTDAENTFITLTARGLNPKLLIVARASQPETESKLRRAGADRVISPYVIGGRRIAAAAVQPTIVEFLDVVMHGENVELAMDEVPVQERSAVAGRTLEHSGIRDESGAVIIAIKDAGGTLHTNPPRDQQIAPGDILIAVGTVRQLQDLAHLCQGDEA